MLPRVPPRSKRGGFADSLAREFKKGCGGRIASGHASMRFADDSESAEREPRIQTGDTRRMKPLPYHLATPLLIKENWHGVPVLPRTCKGLEASLRKLTPAVW